MVRNYFNLLDYNFNKTKEHRIFDLTVSIRQAKNPSYRVYFLTIRLFVAEKDDFITLMTAEHPIATDVSRNREKVRKKVYSIDSVRQLSRNYLLGRDIDDSVKALHRELRLINVENSEFALYNIYYPALLPFKYNSPNALMLKNGHHYYTIIRDLLHFREPDFEKHTMFQISELIPDLISEMGICIYDMSDGIDNGYIHVKKDDIDLTCQSYIPMTQSVLQRKAETGKYCVIQDEVKRAFGISFSKFALLMVKTPIFFEIDKNCNVQKAGVL
mgnify:CR=1 FL=1